MIPGLEALHFLRPAWLWALVPMLLILWAAARQSALARWRGVVAPHLLKHLVVRPRKRFTLRPVHLLALAIAAVALSSPPKRGRPAPRSTPSP